MCETPLLVFGARNFAEEIADITDDIPGFRVTGFVENLDPTRDKVLGELPIHWIDDVSSMAKTHHAVCGLGTNRRKDLVQRVKAMGFRFPPILHPTARVSSSAVIGEGAIVSVGAVISARTQIGNHVLVNRGALIGHHVQIDDFTSIGPGCNVGGRCLIESGVWVGIGATVINDIEIGAGTVIGAGAVVTKNTPKNVLAVGVPAKVVKQGIDGL